MWVAARDKAIHAPSQSLRYGDDRTLAWRGQERQRPKGTIRIDKPMATPRPNRFVYGKVQISHVKTPGA